MLGLSRCLGAFIPTTTFIREITPLLGSFTQKWESFWESFRALGQLWLNQNVLGELFSGHETALVDFIDKVESMIMFVYYSWMKGDGRKLFITAG